MAATTSADERARAQGRVRWELLLGLIRKDLKIKYQGSALGFVWSLINPLVLLAVYTFVFQIVLRAGIPKFGFFLLSALLPWTFLSGSVTFATDCGRRQRRSSPEGPISAQRAADDRRRLQPDPLRSADAGAAGRRCW